MKKPTIPKKMLGIVTSRHDGCDAVEVGLLISFRSHALRGDAPNGTVSFGRHESRPSKFWQVLSLQEKSVRAPMMVADRNDLRAQQNGCAQKFRSSPFLNVTAARAMPDAHARRVGAFTGFVERFPTLQRSSHHPRPSQPPPAGNAPPSRVLGRHGRRCLGYPRARVRRLL